jgi:hypothetical protein
MMKNFQGERMRYRVMLGLMLILISVLTACQPPDETVTPAPEDVVQWNKDPYAVVFRAEIVGGDNQDAFFMLNDVPACTIYGDGRIVWTIDGVGARQVLFDYIQPDALARFIVELGITRKFYEYKEGFPLQLPSSSKPIYERLTLENNDIKYVSDSFSQWPFEYYNQALQLCIEQARTPRTFEPEAAWVSAQQMEYDARIPSLQWDADAAGLSFFTLAGTQERRWLEGSLVKILWNAIKENGFDVQFAESEKYYRIALQVPGLTRDAPPAPSAETAP